MIINIKMADLYKDTPVMKMLDDLKFRLLLVGLSECPADCLSKNSIHPSKAEFRCYSNCIARE